MPWQPPNLAVKWGPYFKADIEEQQKVIALVQESLGGSAGTALITLHQGVEKIAPIFGIENIDAAVKALEEEKAEREKEQEIKAQRELDAAMKAMGQDATQSNRDSGRTQGREVDPGGKAPMVQPGPRPPGK